MLMIIVLIISLSAPYKPAGLLILDAHDRGL